MHVSYFIVCLTSLTFSVINCRRKTGCFVIWTDYRTFPNPDIPPNWHTPLRLSLQHMADLRRAAQHGRPPTRHGRAALPIPPEQPSRRPLFQRPNIRGRFSSTFGRDDWLLKNSFHLVAERRGILSRRNTTYVICSMPLCLFEFEVWDQRAKSLSSGLVRSFPVFALRKLAYAFPCLFCVHARMELSGLGRRVRWWPMLSTTG